MTRAPRLTSAAPPSGGAHASRPCPRSARRELNEPGRERYSSTTSDPKTMAMPARAPAGTSPRPRRDPCRTRTDPRTRRHGVGSGPYTQRRLRTAPRTVRPGRRRSTGSVPSTTVRPSVSPSRRESGTPATHLSSASRKASNPPLALAAPRFRATRRPGLRLGEHPQERPAGRGHRCGHFVGPHQRVVGRPVIDHHDFEKPVGLERAADRGFQGCRRVVRRDDDAEIACGHVTGPSIAGSSAPGMASKSGPTSKPKTGTRLRMAAMVPSELCRAPGS